MNDKETPDIDDIDDFLLRDRVADASTTDLPKLVVGDTIASVHAASKLARLNHRITYASSNLATALNETENWHAYLDSDKECSIEFAEDLEHWDAVMSDLEAAASFIPEALETNAESESSEDVAATIASNFDAEIMAVAEKEEMFDKLISPDDGNQLIGDDDATVKSNQEELLRGLAAQEQRVQELESRLKNSLAHQGSTESKPEQEVTAPVNASTDPYVNRLIVVVNGNENLKFPLSQNIMTIGREPHNEIHIRSRYISRFHARILSDQQGSTVEDLDSRNGISVNSEKVHRKQLRSGDLIDLGGIQLKFIDLMEDAPAEGQA